MGVFWAGFTTGFCCMMICYATGYLLYSKSKNKSLNLNADFDEGWRELQ